MINGVLTSKHKEIFHLNPSDAIITVGDKKIFHCEMPAEPNKWYTVSDHTENVIIYAKTEFPNKWLKKFMGEGELCFIGSENQKICSLISTSFFSKEKGSVLINHNKYPLYLPVSARPMTISIPNVDITVEQKEGLSNFHITNSDKNLVLPSICLLYHFWCVLWGW